MWGERLRKRANTSFAITKEWRTLMKERYLSLSAFLLLGLLLAACGSGGIRSDGGSATATPIPAPSGTSAPPSPIPTDAPEAIPTGDPAGQPTATPRPPAATHDPSRPITFDEIRAFVEAAGPAYDTPPDLSWALKQIVADWEGWV